MELVIALMNLLQLSSRFHYGPEQDIRVDEAPVPHLPINVTLVQEELLQQLKPNPSDKAAILEEMIPTFHLG
ncbi:hypothetical protein GBA52_013368 [Prunus armeniaca]|nr:hypothetical protein GBA52_013368 [Prunus armeniaca]